MKIGKLINVIDTSIYISFIFFRMYIFKSHFKLTVSTIKEPETRIGIETLFYYYSIHAHIFANYIIVKLITKMFRPPC